MVDNRIAAYAALVLRRSLAGRGGRGAAAENSRLGRAVPAGASRRLPRYNESVVAADRCISLHPGHRDIAYAYYLKALDYYVQIADVARDQKQTQQAMTALSEVVRRFPESKYGRDSRLKIDLARDHLAGKEMEIGRYYERQGSYLAAIN